MQSEKSAFYVDASNTTGNIGDYVFDDLYRNAMEKKRLAHNPKFTYFNMITRMKNQLGQHKRDLCAKIFSGYQEENQKQRKKYSSFASNTISNDKKVFHVERINNRSFKIYKEKNSLPPSIEDQIPKMRDINFKVNFTREKTGYSSQRPKIRSVIADYEKINSKRVKSDRPKTTGRPSKLSMSENFHLKGNFGNKRSNIIKIG